MTLLFMDGFDHYADADILTRWTSRSNSSISSSNPRTGTQCYFFETSGATPDLYKDLGANYATLIVGAAWRTNTLAAMNITSLRDAGTEQVGVRLKADGQLEVYGGGGAVIGTTVMGTPFAVNTYYYVEIKATIHDTTGAVTIAVNGVTVLTLTNVDTKNTANAYVNRVRFGPNTTFQGQQRIDDVYVCDTAGSINNDLLGDSQINTLYPTGNGNYSQFTGSDGNSTDNYLLVDEAQHNSDTDYVESNTVGQRDSYAVTDIATGGTVRAVYTHAVVKKTSAGARTFKKSIRLSGTDYDETADTPGTTYSRYSHLKELNPATAAAWTPTEVNGMEIGIKVES